jgi:hypothetical protein
MTLFYFINFLWHWTSNLQYDIIIPWQNKMSELIYREYFYRVLEHCSSQCESYGALRLYPPEIYTPCFREIPNYTITISVRTAVLRDTIENIPCTI